MWIALGAPIFLTLIMAIIGSTLGSTTKDKVIAVTLLGFFGAFIGIIAFPYLVAGTSSCSCKLIP